MVIDNQQLELEKFFEIDIIEFLDEKAKKIHGAEKSTMFENALKKLEEALQKKNIDLVIDILDQYSNEYNSLTSDDAYKAITYNQFMELVDITKKYAAKGVTNPDLEDILTQITQMDENKEKSLPDKINAFQKIKLERARKKIEEEQQLYKIQEEINKKRKVIEKNLFINIRKKRLKESILDYKQLKELFQQYPDKLEQEKQEFYNDLIAFFMQIKKLKQELQTKTSNLQINNIEQQKQEPEINTLEIQEIINEIKKYVNENNFELAKNKIIELKHISSKIENNKLREILDSKITAINQNIELAKKVAEQKT